MTAAESIDWKVKGAPPVTRSETVTVVPPIPNGQRTVTLTTASSIKIRPVKWTWDERIPAASLSLCGGREGIGKSTVTYTLAADITVGKLPGQYFGEPRSVVIAATEDAWEYTIVPRLMAAGADLDRVYRVDVVTAEGIPGALSLPRDITDLARLIVDNDVALVLLDPLLSRLEADLDSHKDADVRVALEPLTALCERTGVAVLGIIHVNKSHSTDPLTLLMASRAFAAVARAVLFVMTDPDDDQIRLLGQPKNNLGRTDHLPTLTFKIDSHVVAETDEGPVVTGKLTWLGESDRTIRDALESAGDTPDTRTATNDALGWLTDYLTDNGGAADHADIKRAGAQAGHSIDALKRARTRGNITSTSYGYPRRTQWALPGTQIHADPDTAVSATHGESTPTALTTPTAPTDQRGPTRDN